MEAAAAVGLAAEQRVFRELTLHQRESDYKVLGLYCRPNMDCLNEEDTPNKEKTSSAALSACETNILETACISCKGVLIYVPLFILSLNVFNTT